MKRNIFASLFLIGISFVLFSFNTPSKDDKTVNLSNVSSNLQKYQGDKNLDFVGDSIAYKSIGKDNYDKIFSESAIAYATILQVSGTIDGINNGKIPADADFALANINFAVKDLPTMKDKINSLLEAIQKLNPKDDFKGLEMKKAPKAVSGISLAKRQLTASAAKLPKLLDDLTAISKKVIK